jgi:uncharacterized protein (UPF0216 family)
MLVAHQQPHLLQLLVAALQLHLEIAVVILMEDHQERRVVIQDSLEVIQGRVVEQVLLQDRVVTLQDNVKDQYKNFVVVNAKISLATLLTVVIAERSV